MAKDRLHFGVALAPLVPPTDVVKRQLTVTVDGAAQEPVTIGATDAEFPDIAVPQDAQVKLEIVDIDDAGNASAPLVYEFQAKDTIPPAQPSGLAVAPKGETEGVDQAPTAPTAPTAPSGPTGSEAAPTAPTQP